MYVEVCGCVWGGMDVRGEKGAWISEGRGVKGVNVEVVVGGGRGCREGGAGGGRVMSKDESDNLGAI